MTDVAVKNNDRIDNIHANLTESMEAKKDALPKSINMLRFSQNCMMVLKELSDKKKITLDQLDPHSIANTFLEGAFLGLDFLNKECYAIPYGNKLQFQTDYRGDIKTVRKYSMRKIKDVYAKLFREGDQIDTSIVDGKQNVNFNPQPFNDNKILGAFAVIIFEDDSLIYDTMSIKEIGETRDNYSKMSTGKSWKNSFGEMAKKTVLKRVCKLVTLDFDSIEQRNSWDSDVDFEKKMIDVTPKKELVTEEQALELKQKSEKIGNSKKMFEALGVDDFNQIPADQYKFSVDKLDSKLKEMAKVIENKAQGEQVIIDQ